MNFFTDIFVKKVLLIALFCVTIIRKYDESKDLENDPQHLNQIINKDSQNVSFEIFKKKEFYLNRKSFKYNSVNI